VDVEAILTEWYVGEQGGRALFDTLAHRGSGEAARKWHALAAVEDAVAQSLSGALRARHIPLPPIEHVGARAEQRCDAIAGRNWPETMQWLHDIADRALQKMQAQAAQLPTELATVGAMVVRHEIALVEFAELELAERSTESLRPIDAFLDSLA
jgi:hypothetical protein